MIEIKCVKCGQLMRLAPPKGPAKVSCPKCGQAMMVGGTPKASPASPTRKPAATPKTPPKQSIPAQAAPSDPFSDPTFPASPPTARPAKKQPARARVSGGKTASAPARTSNKNASTIRGGMLPWAIGGSVIALASVIGLAVWMFSSPEEAGPNEGMGAPASLAAGRSSGQVANATAGTGEGSGSAPSASASQPSQTPQQYYESILSSDSSPHQQAMNDFVRLGGEFGVLLDKARTAGVDPNVAQSIKAIGQKFLRLSDRIGSFPPLDENGRKSLLTAMRNDPAIKVDTVKKQVEQFRNSPAARDRSVSRNYNIVASHFASVQTRLVDSTRAMPQPFGFTAETELLMWESHRRLAALALAVQTEADLQGLAANFDQETQRMAKQRKSHNFFIRTTPVFGKKSTYKSWYNGMESMLNRRMEELSETFDLAALKDNIASFEAAKASIFSVKEDYKDEQKKISEAREAERQKQWDKMPEDVKQRRKEFEEKMNAESRERFEKSIQRERDQHPADEFVVIQLNRPLPFFKKFEWEDRLEESLMCDDVTSHEVSDEDSPAAITLAYDGTIDDVADAIWFGKVINRDTDKRMIEVQMNEDLEE